MTRTVNLLAFLTLFLSPVTSTANENFKRQALHVLQEMAAYKDADSDFAYKLYVVNKPLEAWLTPEKQIEWNFNVAIIANSIDNLDVLAHTLNRLNTLASEIPFKQWEADFLRYTGHYQLKRNQYDSAIAAYLCALPRTLDQRQAIALTYSIGAALISSNQPAQAIRIFNTLNGFLHEDSNPRWVGLTNEAIGVIALGEQKYQLAASSFRIAMDIQQRQVNRRSELNAALNLLLTYTLAKDFEHFERIKPRLERLISININEDLNTYFRWIKAARQQQQWGNLPAKTLETLKKEYYDMSSALIANAITRYLLPILAPDAAPRNPPQKSDNASQSSIDVVAHFNLMQCEQHPTHISTQIAGILSDLQQK